MYRTDVPPRVPSGSPSNLIFLRQVRRQQNGVRGRRGERTADREAAHLLGRCEIPLQQRRRELPDTDVVEPVARVVFWQERRDVNVDTEQVADRVLILGAIQAAERLGAAWIREPRPRLDRARSRDA